jgi:signal transduction histidine kinase
MSSARETQHGEAFEHARERLQQLYEISQLFTGFQSVDITVSTALSIMARTLALRSAILIVDTEGFSQTSVWHAPGVSEQALLAAEMRAHAVCARLTDPALTESAEKDGPRSYSGVITGSAVDDVAGALERPRVLLLPLVIACHPLFGALQLEVSAPVDEPDLAFASAITQQLAIALDRHRALQQEMVLRARAETLAQSQSELRARAQAARVEAEILASRLMQQKNWLRALLDLVPVPLLLVDPSVASITFANRAADAMAWRELLSVGSATEHGHLLELTDANQNQIPADQFPLARVARGEHLTAVQMNWRTSTGTKSFLLDSGLLPAAHGHPASALITFEDITELKEIEATLHKAVNHRDEFISIAAHELRNPLSALQLTVATIERASMKEGSNLSREWVAPRLTRCRAQTARLSRLIDNLLDVSRLTAERLDLEPEDDMNLSAVVREEIERMQAENPGASITLQASADVSGHWDRLRLDQVVNNLLSNAVKYGRGNPIDVSVESSGGTAQLVVTDRGIGIAPDDQCRVFERFERAVPGRKFIGFGLGLWITKQLVEAMRGTIGLESTLGEGSVFTVQLPRA